MNPFDHELSENDLIAYHLQELSTRQARYVRRMLQQNAALAAESEAIAETLRAFPKQEAGLPVDADTRERFWLALLPSLTVHFPKRTAPLSRLRRWSLPMLAGTAFAATAILVSLHHVSLYHDRGVQPSTVASIGTHAPTVPAPAPSATSPNATFATNAQPNAFTPHPRTLHHALFSSSGSSSSAPAETELAKNVTPSFPTEPSPTEPSPTASTAPSTPTGTSSGAAGRAATKTPAPLLANQVSGQSPAPSSSQPSKFRRVSTVHYPHTSDFTLGIFGDFLASRSSTYTYGAGTSAVTDSLAQAATAAVGALASFHQQLRPWLGYRLTTAYSRPTFEYSGKLSGEQDSYAGTTAILRIYEFSGAYVVQGPHGRRFSTSAEAGAGLVDFLPTDPEQSSSSNGHVLRAAAIVGVGSEYALTKHWGLHAEYRAQLYKPPAFYFLPASAPPPSGSVTFSNSPIVGINYRFGAKGND